MLLDIVRVTGLGRLYAVPARRTSRPQVVWSVTSKLDGSSPAVAAVLSSCAAELRALRRYVDPEGVARVDRARAPARPGAAISAFLGGFFTGEGSFSLTRRAVASVHLRVLTTDEPATEAYLEVLRAFAAEQPDGALTCTAYAQARAGHPEWPTRNTLALAFGTWAQALAAAGLGSRTSGWQRERQKRARPRE